MSTSGIYFDTILDENLIFQYSIKTFSIFFFHIYCYRGYPFVKDFCISPFKRKFLKKELWYFKNYLCIYCQLPCEELLSAYTPVTSV